MLSANSKKEQMFESYDTELNIHNIHDYFHFINKPTSLSNHCHSIIDSFLIALNMDLNSGIILYVGDHFTIFCISKLNVSRKKQNKVYFKRHNMEDNVTNFIIFVVYINDNKLIMDLI